MKFYISTKGIKRVTISNTGKGSPKTPAPAISSSRRIPVRTALPAAVVLGILLPFLFVRIAILALESASVRSSFDCGGWKFFGGADASLKLRDELTRALIEANDGNVNEGSESFNELVKEMATKDLKAFAFKTKAMLLQMERKVQLARQQESVYWHLASHGIPKSIHCLCLKLAEEYAVNAIARSRLPSPEYVTRLVDPTFQHLVLLTDNVLAASVVVTSTIENSANPEKLVIHIVTDKKTYTPMHAWFATNSIKSSVVEVRGLHQYDWSEEVNAGVKEMLETNHLIWKHYHNKGKDLSYSQEHNRYLETLRPSSRSLMNHLRIYIPELFPDLKKIVVLDDDVVVQHDISSLWKLDLNGKVGGSVFKSWCGGSCCPGSKYANYLNFSHPLISSKIDGDQCTWLYGMNVFDLEAWRRTNITETYHHWLKLNLESGLELWSPGVLPPSLIAFEGQVHSINSSMLVTGLGHRHRSEEISRERLEAAAVIHFSGPAKPWLEISFPEVRSLWIRYVNFSDKFIRRCGITG